ncbi:MAG: hypothetical protein GTO53_12170 [Planctomycetales bacterium]|nr:hypothetical protein [Planctomycetales bacterium]NIM09865.1 hypothetical protein [Planctomycetales bacterium]NIN09305.1 hypothetical protein [Planctomycetales bacterium]NIN78413.1 hypothetical protein [Planctomycetales bacterium]NIO35589.1 hypothetical protein [Planctomycetales bacterium]
MNNGFALSLTDRVKIGKGWLQDGYQLARGTLPLLPERLNRLHPKNSRQNCG